MLWGSKLIVTDACGERWRQGQEPREGDWRPANRQQGQVGRVAYGPGQRNSKEGGRRQRPPEVKDYANGPGSYRAPTFSCPEHALNMKVRKLNASEGWSI